jgi:hypothetical protein
LAHIRSIDEVKRVIQAALAEKFEGVRIIEVNVKEDDDFEDDDYLRVEVVFEGNAKDVSWFSGAIGFLRPKLASIGETTFPVLSFTSSSDLIGRQLEPA